MGDIADAAVEGKKLAADIQQVAKGGGLEKFKQDFLTIAPARVETKARYGLPWFEQRWAALQLQLF